MPNEPGTPGTTGGEGTPLSGGTPTPGTPNPGTPPAGEVYDHKAFTAMRDELAALKAAKAEPAKKDPPKEASAGDAMAEIAQLRFERDLEKAFTSAKIPEGPLRDLIETAAVSKKPGDLKAFVAGYAALTPPVAAAGAAKPQAGAKSNLGAPGGTPASGLPSDPRLMDPAEWAALPSADRMKRQREFLAQNGTQNPFYKPRPGHSR